MSRLKDSQQPDCAVEVITVINSGAQHGEEIRHQNSQTLTEARAWAAKNDRERLRFHFLYFPDLPKKHAGVGLARKIGMDEAVRRLDKVNRHDAPIICFDADARCSPNYLAGIEAYFQAHPKVQHCSLHFEHPLEGDLPAEAYEAIVRYELYLRYYVNGLRFAQSPYAHHTIGSSMAVRSALYQREGGMNRRKAGEDFYFLNKLPRNAHGELTSVMVIPSPRASHRVPFGTGKAIGAYMESPEEDYPVYAPEGFRIWREVMTGVGDWFEMEEGQLKEVLVGNRVRDDTQRAGFGQRIFSGNTVVQRALPDGSARHYESGVTAFDVANDISAGLARKTVAAVVNGDLVEITRTIDTDATVKLATWDDPEGKYAFWHSSAHIMAEALEALFPGVKLAYGPPVKDGFYYDVDFGDYKFGSGDFAKVEKKFLELARGGEVFEREVVSREHAINFYKERGNNYKVELIERLPEDETITFYHSGGFTDLCRGGHVPNSKIIKAFKIMKVAGAYFMGDESRGQLTRVYGTSFPKAKLLTEHLERIELAKQRDHRKLGKEMELFTFSEKVGLGLPLWLPNGAKLRGRLEDFLKQKQIEAGYDPVITPHIGKKDLYETSGHWAKYGQDSFRPIQTPNENEQYLLKPMNCPHHCEIYKSRPRSYKELPLRFAEFGTVYRYEQHGELHGLTRVRGFTQDDAHLFCRSDQLKDEFKKVIDLVLYIFSTLEFTQFKAQVSLRTPGDDKYIGSDEAWDMAENAIREAAAERGLDTVEVEGEAAFYGPKLDFMVMDALGREWQLGTIQVDYNLPERFELEYVGEDNQMHRPVMIHRAPFGSMERFVAVLLEHTGGDLPIWLTTDQVAILPISDRYNNYAEKVFKELKNSDIRAFIDDRSEKVGRKIRDAEVKKVPYMLIVGEKEQENSLVSVRKHREGDKGAMELAKFAEIVQEDILKSLKLN